MKKTKFTEAQRGGETGVAVAEVCFKMGISEAPTTGTGAPERKRISN